MPKRHANPFRKKPHARTAKDREQDRKLMKLTKRLNEVEIKDRIVQDAAVGAVANTFPGTNWLLTSVDQGVSGSQRVGSQIQPVSIEIQWTVRADNKVGMELFRMFVVQDMGNLGGAGGNITSSLNNNVYNATANSTPPQAVDLFSENRRSKYNRKGRYIVLWDSGALKIGPMTILNNATTGGEPQTTSQNSHIHIHKRIKLKRPVQFSGTGAGYTDQGQGTIQMFTNCSAGTLITEFGQVRLSYHDY